MPVTNWDASLPSFPPAASPLKTGDGFTIKKNQKTKNQTKNKPQNKEPITSYIWFYTYVHRAHGWSTTAARKALGRSQAISKEGLGWGVPSSCPSWLPLKPTWLHPLHL